MFHFTCEWRTPLRNPPRTKLASFSPEKKINSGGEIRLCRPTWNVRVAVGLWCSTKPPICCCWSFRSSIPPYNLRHHPLLPDFIPSCIDDLKQELTKIQTELTTNAKCYQQQLTTTKKAMEMKEFTYETLKQLPQKMFFMIGLTVIEFDCRFVWMCWTLLMCNCLPRL